jgi:hypothetical protein
LQLKEWESKNIDGVNECVLKSVSFESSNNSNKNHNNNKNNNKSSIEEK